MHILFQHRNFDAVFRQDVCTLQSSQTCSYDDHVSIAHRKSILL